MKFFNRIKEYIKYYPEEENLPIDWCPICEEKLKDNKRKTRIEHNNKAHRMTPEEKRKRKLKRIRDIIIWSAFIIMMAGFVYWVSDVVEKNQYCRDQEKSLNVIIAEEERFPVEHLDKFDDLVKNCDLVFDLNSNTGYQP